MKKKYNFRTTSNCEKDYYLLVGILTSYMREVYDWYDYSYIANGVRITTRKDNKSFSVDAILELFKKCELNIQITIE